MRKLFISQYGDKIFAETVKELRSQIGNGGSRVKKMYRDGKNGKIYHVGYVIGGLWLKMYAPIMILDKSYKNMKGVTL